MKRTESCNTFYLFDLILYVPVNNFSVMSGQVFLGFNSTEQGLMSLEQPETPRSLVKHSTTEPLHSLNSLLKLTIGISAGESCLSLASSETGM